MSPVLTTLLSNSASIGKLTPDNQLLVELWLTAQLFGIPSDWTTLSNLPNGFKSLGPDQVQRMFIYSIANKLGLPTDGQALLNFVKQSTGNPSPQGQDLPYFLNSIWLKNAGAFANIA